MNELTPVSKGVSKRQEDADGQLVTDVTYTLISNYYFPNEVRLLLEKAGFTIEAEKGDWTDADVTAANDTIVYFARK